MSAATVAVGTKDEFMLSLLCLTSPLLPAVGNAIRSPTPFPFTAGVPATTLYSCPELQRRYVGTCIC